MRVVPRKCSPFTIGPASYLFVSAYGRNQRKNEYIGLSPPENARRSFKIICILVSVCKRRSLSIRNSEFSLVSAEVNATEPFATPFCVTDQPSESRISY